jgi:peptidoglycan/LPS O-acetylase OafA/YrhL
MRNLGLDLVRFCAVLLVLFRHFDFSQMTHPAFTFVNNGGWVGVDLFFVLSGFLISSLLFQEFKRDGELKLGRFLARRIFKIWPPFWLVIVATVFLATRMNLSFDKRQLWNEILLIQNYFPGIYVHTWSLAVEEHFYVALFLVLSVLKKYRPNSFLQFLPKLCLFFMGLCFLWRMASVFLEAKYGYTRHMFATHLRIDSLLFGVLLSYFVQFRNLLEYLKKVPSYCLITVGILLLLPAFIFSIEKDRWILGVGANLFYLGSGMIILAAVRIKNSQKMYLRLCGALGAVSYSVYLWHIIVKDCEGLVIKKLTGHFPTATTLFWGYFLGSFFVGWIVNRFFELPVLWLRDKILEGKRAGGSPLKYTVQEVPAN